MTYVSTIFRGYSNLTRPVKVSSLSGMTSLNFEKLRASIVNIGYAVAQSNNSSYDFFYNFSSFFGKAQKSQGSDSYGIKKVLSDNHPAGNVGVVSSLPFYPHTDGAYLNGVLFDGASAQRILPPKLVLLQCVEPAQKGGDNILYDGKKILLSVHQKEPCLLPFLFDKYSISLTHGSVTATDVPVFKKLNNGSFIIRYSYDGGMVVSEKSKEAIEHFNQKFIIPEASIKLKKGDIIIIDNHRMLHSREFF